MTAPIFLMLVENTRAALGRARRWLTDWPLTLERIAEGGGWRANLVLASTPLWLTPEVFGRLDRLRRRRAIFGNLTAASGLWLWASQPLLAPMLPMLEATIDQVGRATSYWDPAWAPWWAQTLFLATTLLLFLGVAGLEWLMVKVACGLSRLAGDARVRPPPFAYFALTTAGAIAGLATALSLMLFAAAPVNAPVWAWLSRPEGAVFGVAVGLALMALIFRRDQVALARSLQIYGGGRRAVAYQASSLFVVVGSLLAVIALLRLSSHG